MSTNLGFSLHAAGLDDLQAAKREWSQRLLRPEATAGFSARAFAAAVSPVPEQNVVGVGIDEKYVEDTPTGVRCLKFLVKSKFPPGQLTAKDQLPGSVAGLPTDVEEVGVLVPFGKARAAKTRSRKPAAAAAPTAGRIPNPRKRLRPAQPGCSVGFRDPGDAFVMAGTFGALVEDDDGQYVLSNNHVLANENALPAGAAIFQPGLLDNGDPDTDQIAELTRFVELKTGETNKVDGAVARALKPSLVRRDILFIGAPAGTATAEVDMVVHKFGRTTGYRAGRVSSVEFDVKIPYDIGVVTFENQIAVRGLNGQRFSDQGDSGSAIVVRATRQVVGLLFGGRTDGTLTFANHIADVLAALGVTLA
jgi:hypothetical protein